MEFKLKTPYKEKKKRGITEGIELLNQESNQNIRSKRKLQILWNIRSGYHQRNGEKTKQNKTKKQRKSQNNK